MTVMYEPELAAKYKGCGKPYRPSNGWEGEIFQENFCSNCKRDEAYRKWWEETGGEGINPDGCSILADTFCFSADHPSYPKEWRYDDDGQPTCTAFEEVE